MKLISKPTECGYRIQVFTRLGLPSGIYVCKHSSTVAGKTSCYNEDEFPTDCPLHNGITIQKALLVITAGTLAINAAEDALTIAEKIVNVKPKRRNIVRIERIALCGKSHKHTYYKNGKRTYPKRNRKNCRYFYNCARHFIWLGAICNTDATTGTHGVGPCKGVNCGSFKIE